MSFALIMWILGRYFSWCVLISTDICYVFIIWTERTHPTVMIMSERCQNVVKTTFWHNIDAIFFIKLNVRRGRFCFLIKGYWWTQVEHTCILSWWRHQINTFSALLAICAGNSSVPGEFPTQRPVTRSFDVFFDLRLNKRLSKQPWAWWFETPSWSLWRHCHDIVSLEWLSNCLVSFYTCWPLILYKIIFNCYNFPVITEQCLEEHELAHMSSFESYITSFPNYH